MVAGWLLVGAVFLGILIFFKIFGKFVFGLVLSFAILAGFLILSYNLFLQLDKPDNINPSTVMGQGEDYFSWVGDFFQSTTDKVTSAHSEFRESGEDFIEKIPDFKVDDDIITDKLEKDS